MPMQVTSQMMMVDAANSTHNTLSVPTGQSTVLKQSNDDTNLFSSLILKSNHMEDANTIYQQSYEMMNQTNGS